MLGRLGFMRITDLDKIKNYAIIKTGSEAMALENQRYGRNKDTLVNKTYIESGEYKRKYDNATDSQAVNKALYTSAKEALKHRSGTAFEDMYWIDANSGEIIYFVADSTDERAIIYTDKIKKVVNTSREIITIHTHPSSMPPSVDDFNSCFHNGYKAGFIACHNGKVYRYTSNQKISRKLYELYVENFHESGNDEFTSQLMAINKIMENHDITFEEVPPND